MKIEVPTRFARVLDLPLRLGLGGNDRLHWRAADRQKKNEKEVTRVYLGRSGWLVRPPCTVTITRVSPGNGIDDDNLSSSAKYVRDSVARWLAVDDADPSVKYVYRQERGPWCTRVEITTP